VSPTRAELSAQRRAFIRQPRDPFYHLARALEARGLAWDSSYGRGAQAFEKFYGMPQRFTAHSYGFIPTGASSVPRGLL
jgi:hypothetical protein